MNSNSIHDGHLEAIRHKVTRNFCLFCFGVALLSVPASFMARERVTLLINTAAIFLYAVPLLVLFKAGNYRLAAKIFICVATGATLVNALATNFDTHIPTVVWYFVYLVFADLVLGGGWAIGVAGVGLVSISLFSVLRLTGHCQINPPLVEESIIIGSPIALFVSFVMLLYLLTIYKKVRNLMFRNLVEANIEKNRLVGTMSHDMRNYLGAITGVASLMRDEISPKNDAITEDVMKYLDIIDSASSRAIALVEEVVGAVRTPVEADRKMYFEVLDLHQFITPILQRYKVLSQKKGVHFICTEPAEHFRASINKDAFSRVIENILSNAFKFTRKGDTITVSIKGEGRDAVISVADTGIGIPPELKNALFEPYTSAGRPGTGNEKSIGLGLSIVKKFVDMHGGKVDFESEADKGTTFFIRLKRL